MLIPVEHSAVLLLEHLGVQGLSNRLPDLFLGWPDVLEGDRLAAGAIADRLGAEVNINPPGEGVRDDQHGRGQVVGLHLWMDTPFKVPVPGEDSHAHQVSLIDGLGDVLREWTRVPDAGRTAVAHEMEAETLQVRHQPGGLQIVGHHLGARG